MVRGLVRCGLRTIGGGLGAWSTVWGESGRGIFPSLSLPARAGSASVTGVRNDGAGLGSSTTPGGGSRTPVLRTRLGYSAFPRLWVALMLQASSVKC